MEDSIFTPGLTERLMKEIIETPALKEIILLQMKDVKAETAPGVVKTLLWGDPGISMSLFGAAPDAINWLLELLLELGRQLNGIPEPLLKDILGRIGAGRGPGEAEPVPPRSTGSWPGACSSARARAPRRCGPRWPGRSTPRWPARTG